MAQNITLLGNSYPDVPSVTLPKTGGGTASFTDVTDTTASASDVAQGKYFYTSGGVKTEGTASGGGGGGEVERKDVNFYDYDGTCVASYTAQEFANLSALPSNPSHTGLTAQGWNYTKAEITTEVTAQGKCDVGQMYVTASGDTEIDVDLSNCDRLDPILTIAVKGTVTVDWGDGSSADTVTANSLTTKQAVPHTYSVGAKYTIKIHVTTGTFSFLGNSNYLLLRKNTDYNASRLFSNRINAIRIGNDVTQIGANSFAYCQGLETVTIPNTVATIYSYVFNYCDSLKYITIPSSTTKINSYCFQYCRTIKGVSIPRSVTTIGEYSFQYCYIIKHLTIPSSVTTIDRTSINNIYTLQNLTIPEGVTTLGNSAFSSCYSLTSLTVPSSVTSIGNSAFSGLYGVKEYHIKPTTVPTIGTNAFTNIQSDCIIYVPSAKLNDYKTASNWSTYASYMQGE